MNILDEPGLSATPGGKVDNTANAILKTCLSGEIIKQVHPIVCSEALSDNTGAGLMAAIWKAKASEVSLSNPVFAMTKLDEVWPQLTIPDT